MSNTLGTAQVVWWILRNLEHGPFSGLAEDIAAGRDPRLRYHDLSQVMFGMREALLRLDSMCLLLGTPKHMNLDGLSRDSLRWWRTSLLRAMLWDAVASHFANHQDRWILGEGIPAGSQIAVVFRRVESLPCDEGVPLSRHVLKSGCCSSFGPLVHGVGVIHDNPAAIPIPLGTGDGIPLM